MISIYTIHYNRLEFLALQYQQLVKHCLDEFEYIVINNGIDVETEQKISEFCKNNNILEIKITQQNRQQYCSHDHIMALDYVYRNYVATNTSDLRIIMDSDIIAYSKLSFFNIIENYEIAGFKVYTYSSAIFTMYGKSVDLNEFNINDGGDSGSGTGKLVEKYNTKWLNITAPIREEEANYIFHYKEDCRIKYDISFGFQFIESCFIHFYRGTGWDNGDVNYFMNKFEFLTQFLLHPELYEITLDSNVQYPDAFNDQWLNKQNYKLYNELSNISN